MEKVLLSRGQVFSRRGPVFYFFLFDIVKHGALWQRRVIQTVM